MTLPLLHDIAIVLLAAGGAGVLCKRLGLSVIVGYLLAGIIIGPNMPLALITGAERIEELAEVGLVFVMFAIGLHLSLTKLTRMGMGILIATILVAAFVFGLTMLLGAAIGWDFRQNLFIASMLMVSSSAVVAKVIQELHLTHDKTMQSALTLTVSEDIVAVMMLTILATVVGGSAAAHGGAASTVEAATNVVANGGGDALAAAANVAVEAAENIGSVFSKIGSYVILIIALCVLFVPRLLRRLDMSGDPDLRTVGVAGILLILALAAHRAGFSTALGAFIFGTIVAELPQKKFIEESFSGLHSVFNGIFFVSIGMLADPVKLLDVKVLVLTGGLVLFVMLGRSLACTLAFLLTGMAPHEARRAGIILTPIGEFSFIIAQLAVSAHVFPEYLYPVSITLSVVTVILTPIINRHSAAIVRFIERIEPPFVTRQLTRYHDFLHRAGQTADSAAAKDSLWARLKPMLIGLIEEMLLVSGIFLFSNLFFQAAMNVVHNAAQKSEGQVLLWFDASPIPNIVFSIITGGTALFFIFAIVRRTIAAVHLLAKHRAEKKGVRRVSQYVLFGALAAVVILLWLGSVLPSKLRGELISSNPLNVTRIVLLAIVAIGCLGFSRRLIRLHDAWRNVVGSVLSGANADAEARRQLRIETRKTTHTQIRSNLESWNMHLQDCKIPENAACIGTPLRTLGLPTKFGVSIVEIERSGVLVRSPGPEVSLFPGDEILLLGREDGIAQARELLEAKNAPVVAEDGEEEQIVLETCVVEKSPHSGKTFAQLDITKNTGVRVVGIQRGDTRIGNPGGADSVQDGDGLLLVGTVRQIVSFLKWFQGADASAGAAKAKSGAGAGA